jgi:hypothetical protein
MLNSFINYFFIGMSLATATGVLVHDTHADAALMLPSAIHADSSGSKLSIFSAGNDHTHVERGSLSQAVHELKTPTPSVQPRSSEDKKHLLQKHTARGHHAFDNYNLPIV